MGIDFTEYNPQVPYDDISIAGVDVPDVPCPLSNDALAQLNDSIDPTQESANRGIDIYLETVRFITE